MTKLPLSNRILLHEQKTPPAAPNDLFSAEKEEESSKLGWAEIHKMDWLIEEYGMEARQLSWKSLAYYYYYYYYYISFGVCSLVAMTH